MLEEEGVKIYLKSFWQLKLVLGTWLEDLLKRRVELHLGGSKFGIW